jgi:hypothetical protein
MGYAVRGWLTLVLWAAALAFGILGALLLSRMIHFPDSALVLFAAVVLGGVFLYVGLRGYAGDALVASALAGLGLIVVWRVYGAGIRAFIPVETIESSGDYKPPVLEVGQYIACILVGTGLLIVGHFVERLVRSPRPVHGGSGSV